jgi:hypothetical protein
MPSLPYVNSFFGFQFAARKDLANSRQIINTIEDVKQYGPASLTSKRRASVRKGLRSCEVVTISSTNDSLISGCVDLWNGFVKRTGWKQPLDRTFFERSWKELLDLPGTNVSVARSKETGETAGFLISKIIGSTAYVDTIASSSRHLSLNVNDALMYAMVNSAKMISSVEKVHYAIKSNDKPLEFFKQGIGFAHTPYPSCLHLRPGVGLALKIVSRRNYKRMVGEY